MRLGSKTKQAAVLPPDSGTVRNVMIYSEKEMGKQSSADAAFPSQAEVL